MFQEIYDWFKGIRTPKWLKELFDEVQGIIIASIYQVSLEYIKNIEKKIIDVGQTNQSNETKFLIVYRYARDLGISLPDSIMNVLINALVLRLKNKGAI